MAAVSKGAAGEVLAARFLRNRGYDILTANYRTRLGEIDIIAADKQYIAFVEVKTAIGSREDLGRPTTTAVENKQGFMAYLKG